MEKGVEDRDYGSEIQGLYNYNLGGSRIPQSNNQKVRYNIMCATKDRGVLQKVHQTRRAFQLDSHGTRLW